MSLRGSFKWVTGPLHWLLKTEARQQEVPTPPNWETEMASPSVPAHTKAEAWVPQKAGQHLAEDLNPEPGHL